ncbi:hypothetical protein EDD18DRAFT_1312527 [Armillaria luteobubalina]|uniref:Uncharacterized protein n=1 Tax=Armillaria luteobubalina TaxID=153913 RepID=A0AA39P8G8_9AGAR|nr:hypothetical protein EDD18DRAFT_1312527 [Armillaria luteobubalina]
MHKGESGGWKALFTHLIRVCYAIGPAHRYQSVPTFGHLTIRKFSNDVSGQKKLAARDYEDLLQCSIPCFDGLFPEEDNHIVIDTLFDFAMWHALAKSRMHTDSSKILNLLTYKFHSLGDYCWTIPQFGTTDSYSTQIIHSGRRPHLHPSEKEPLPPANPEDQYQMSASRRYPLDLHSWLAENRDDLALVDFIPKLKDHILPYDDPTPEQRSYLHITNNHIYQHKVLHINYTTYDVCQDQDSINPCTRSDVMVLANEMDPTSTHSYWYAHVIGIFHAEACYHDPNGSLEDSLPFNVNFIWVHWYGFDGKHRSGFKAKQPHWVGFVQGEDPEAFGFLDPSDVIRGTHLVPVYRLGQTQDAQIINESAGKPAMESPVAPSTLSH